MENLLIAKQIALQLSVTKMTVIRMIQRGQFPNAYKLDGRWVIPATDLPPLPKPNGSGQSAESSSPQPSS